MKRQIFNTIKTIKKRIFNQKRERIKKDKRVWYNKNKTFYESLNCGHDAHEGILYRKETDYDGREYEIEVCKHSRYDTDAE